VQNGIMYIEHDIFMLKAMQPWIDWPDIAYS